MPWIGQTRVVGGREQIFTETGWQYTDERQPPEPTWTPPPGYPSEPGTLGEPDPDNYWFVDLGGGTMVPANRDEPGAVWSEAAYTSAMLDYQDWLKGEADRARGYGDGATGPTAAELAIQASAVQASNMANYLDGVIRGVDAEVSAGRLSLDQAQAEFDRRMDALSEAGTQMANLWQWTVPEGAGALHPDIRANLGMEPWESQPISWDPYALAQQIIAETPELTGQPVSTDPIQEALELAQGLI